MAAPFFDNIGGTVTSGPGTAAFTPTAAASMCVAWSTVPSNQIIYYRAEEGTTWENGLGLWNGTTITRNLIISSTGSLISFGTGVIIYAVGDASQVQCHIGGGRWGVWAATGGSSVSVIGAAGQFAQGTGATGTLATTNYMTRQVRVDYTSATTAGATAGPGASGTGTAYLSSTAFMGGFEFVARFGATALPTGPRIAVGMGQSNMGSGEPSASNNLAWFGKDSTDTNIQFMTSAASGSATKVNTGIPLVAGAGYEASIWAASGTAKIFYQLIRLDTGAVFIGSTTTTLPALDTQLGQMCMGSTGTTTGTAIVWSVQSVYLKTSF